MRSTLSFRRLLRHPTETAPSIESSALVAAASVFVLTGALASLLFWDADLPISGPSSVGQFVSLSSFLTGAGMFSLGAVLSGRRHGDGAERPDILDAAPPLRLRWFDVLALAFAHGAIALIGWLAIAELLDRSFPGAMLYSVAGAVLAGVALAVTAYAVYLSAVRLGPMQLSLVLVVFLTCGVFASMLTATDPLWWQKNLSTLGISDDISARAFNVTMIIAGVIISTIAHYAASQLPAHDPKEVSRRREVRVALSVMGVLLAAVGIFPVDAFPLLHTASASGMVAVYLALVIRLRRLVPTLQLPFLVLGYTFLGVIAVLTGFFATGYYTLTAVELVAFLLVFSWLIVFLRATGATPPAVMRTQS